MVNLETVDGGGDAATFTESLPRRYRLRGSAMNGALPSSTPTAAFFARSLLILRDFHPHWRRHDQ